MRTHRHDRAEKDKEEVHAVVTQIMSLTNVAFFGLAGASLKLVGAGVLGCVPLYRRAIT